MNTYHRLPVTFASGKGSYLFDEAGKAYLDFTAGIAVNCLGHAYPPLVRAIAEQAVKFTHVSNYYQSEVSARFAERLVRACPGMKRVFLANSGAEANEGAIKIARKYSLAKYGPGRHTIAALRGSFHGRTITTLSATGQDAFHKDFGPFTEGFVYVEPEDEAALDRALDKHTVAALLVEPVQGESGIRPLSQAFYQAAARCCAERDILLIADEIQCGLGRTGTFFASTFYEVQPDLATLAKGLCAGVPAGAVLAGPKAAETLTPGDHGSTFGGNPLAAAAGLVVLNTVNQDEFLSEITLKGDLMQGLMFGWEHPLIRDIRGRGLMIGVDLAVEARPVLEACLEQGLLVLSAGPKTLRFLPPYTISDTEIEKGLDILKAVLDRIPVPPEEAR
jgi:acetylornithine/N-succinyldiaminopimelate aminotransferase